ncbi:MAG: bifunctional riboflavin kinase/FAD synthetase [Ardenticatenaceae bacterium]|nr:bifunctional riboflavin kinase/FAD synthetase [Anaerolineales bacterium]MCB8938353.1 bifunctional riboflavin kinase/FAD synthetase [Ardenticatenaceae bacterium]MCB8975340.1 bifunctional riboflavin kinase/FAD synthetase [Ardenticatenaceae bacterium]
MTTRVEQLSDVTERVPTFVAVGSFDGVHLGHQAVLQAMISEAKALGARTAVLTFFPHPQRVIQKMTEPYYLGTLDERVALLGNLGIDLIITHPFNDTVRQTRAATFVDELCRYLDMRQMWGGNFALGYQREGDIPFLRKLGEERGYSVQQVEAMVPWQGERVSSSRIRRSLLEGDLAEVNGCLGRPYCVSGTVVEGKKLGRTIGFPTANVDFWEEQLLPTNGVYATYAWLGEERHLAATNVGVRPTVNGSAVTVEAHLLDFDADIYGRTLRLEFMGRIRPEMKFAGLEALKAQIAADVAKVQNILT